MNIDKTNQDVPELISGDYYLRVKLGGDAGIKRALEIFEANGCEGVTETPYSRLRNAYALVYNTPLFGKPRMMIAEEHSNLWARKREVTLPDLPPAQPIDDSVYIDALLEIRQKIDDLIPPQK